MKLICSSGRSQARAINRQTQQIQENAARQERQLKEQARMSQLQLEQTIARERQNRQIQEMEKQNIRQNVDVDVAPDTTDTEVDSTRRRRINPRDRFRTQNSGLNI